MSLLDDIAAATTRKGPLCTLCKLILALPADEAGELVEALGNQQFQGAQIARALSGRYPDSPIAAHSVNRHRNGECRHGKSA